MKKHGASTCCTLNNHLKTSMPWQRVICTVHQTENYDQTVEHATTKGTGHLQAWVCSQACSCEAPATRG